MLKIIANFLAGAALAVSATAALASEGTFDIFGAAGGWDIVTFRPVGAPVMSCTAIRSAPLEQEGFTHRSFFFAIARYVGDPTIGMVTLRSPDWNMPAGATSPTAMYAGDEVVTGEATVTPDGKAFRFLIDIDRAMDRALRRSHTLRVVTLKMDFDLSLYGSAAAMAVMDRCLRIYARESIPPQLHTPIRYVAPAGPR